MDMKATKDGKLSSSHHLTPLVEILKKKKKILVMITQFPQKVHHHSHRNRNQDAVCWTKLSRPAPRVTLKANWHSQQQQRQSMCDDVSTSTRKLVHDRTGMSEATRRMIRLAQRNLCITLCHLLTKSHNSTSISEKEYLKMPSYRTKKR